MTAKTEENITKNDIMLRTGDDGIQEATYQEATEYTLVCLLALGLHRGVP